MRDEMPIVAIEAPMDVSGFYACGIDGVGIETRDEVGGGEDGRRSLNGTDIGTLDKKMQDEETIAAI